MTLYRELAARNNRLARHLRGLPSGWATPIQALVAATWSKY